MTHQAIDLGSVSPGFGRSVLLVDDDPIQRKLVGTQLENAGFEVRATSGAAEALAAVVDQRPDVIVSDVVMDEIDGFSLCRKFRALEHLTRVPVILISTYFDEGPDRALAREVGASALVLRSPDMQDCVEAILRSLVEGGSDAPPGDTSELHLQRVARRMMRFRDETLNAEARYQALFEHANDAISLLTVEGFVLDANRRWEEITGRPREELIGLHIRDFSAPGYESSNTARYRNAMDKAASVEGPVPICRADGTTVYIEFSTTRIDLEGCERVLCIGRDVTALLESHRQLEASERKYRTLVENIPEVLFSATTAGKLTFVSSNASRLLGFSAEEMLAGVHGGPDARIHPDDLAQFRSGLATLASAGTTVELECRWQHRDGRWLWLSCKAVVAENSEGEPCIDGVLADVTARKQLEEQLAHSQKVEAIGQLTAGIAHDFNNILAVIITNSQLLLDGLPESENAEIARDLALAGRRGADLTKHLLAFARRQAANPCNLDPNAVIRDAQRLLRCTLGLSVSLELDQGVELGSIHADARQLEQVLVNLAANARDAMPGGGTLTIETRNADLTGLEDAVRGSAPPRPGSYVAISVRDTGCGMDAATLARLFEPFFTTKGDRGTGLGLSTSYGTVRRYGGHMVVESEPGRGTTFTLYFPRIGSRSVAA